MRLSSFPFFLFCVSAFFAGCAEKASVKLFTLLPATETGISFSNTVTQNDSTNILDYEYTFNGGGVAIADFNNDGLSDVFFTANMQSNALYLNRGELSFQNISVVAGVDGAGRWCTGASAVDINNDGWMDLYVCTSRYNDPEKRKNLLYINEGLKADSLPHFREAAAAYGLADNSFSTQAAFFDYDGDGDLDMYLLVADKMQAGYQPNTYRKKITDGSTPGRDRLYRNDNGHFTEVGREAGILLDGFGLGVSITDINQDGLPDIYVSNDYLSNDLLWINEGNGHFFNAAPISFKHTSYSAMGNDVQDVNNDGLPDIVTLDMLSKDNYRKKTMSPPGNYTNYIYNDFYDYDYQFVRNTFQLNQGLRLVDTINASKPLRLPVFSEIAFLAGMAETDWSWTPLLADFDNDGWRDLIVSNGFAKDLSDRDFLAYRPMATSLLSKKDLLEQIPSVKIPDFAFRNKGPELGFEDVSQAWGLGTASFSNGAAYADLDNDGDLDCIMNCINGAALVYRNNSQNSHWIQFRFEGPAGNRNGIGAKLHLFYAGGRQYLENQPVRGYLSSMTGSLHAGLGNMAQLDSVLVTWPDGRQQLLRQVAGNQVLSVSYASAVAPGVGTTPGIQPYFTDITASAGIRYTAPEQDYIDFNTQRLIPHKLSQYGPSLAVADINNDGREDFFVGGAKGFPGQLGVQQPDGKFLLSALAPKDLYEDAGALFFDADGDGDADVYIVSGGVESPRNTAAYQDRFYRNEKGRFIPDTAALPVLMISGMAVKAADIDNDGDLDLFRSGRVDPGRYPLPVASLLLRNDSQNGLIRFTAVPDNQAPALANAGMVTDAVFTDYDNDGCMDLLVCREAQSPLVLHNEKGRFTDVTAGSGLANLTGWWNSIAGGDFDNDGDIDYVVGNSGTNTLYQCDSAHPVSLYAKDFNGDGKLDAIPTVYFSDSSGQRHEFPAFGRDEMIEQLIGLRRRYPYYREFGRLQLKDILYDKDLEGALVYRIRENRSGYIENRGQGKFQWRPFPVQAQFAPLMGMLVVDVDADGNLDVLLNGNDFGMDMNTGRCDALNGLLLLGNGKGGFEAVSFARSGIFIPGDGRALASLAMGDNTAVLASQNRGTLQLYQRGPSVGRIAFPAGKRVALLNGPAGQKRRVERYFGSSFQSQSSSGWLETSGWPVTWP